MKSRVKILCVISSDFIRGFQIFGDKEDDQLKFGVQRNSRTLRIVVQTEANKAVSSGS